MSGNNIRSITIPPVCNIEGNDACCGVCSGSPLIVTGWGLNEQNILPDMLQQLRANVFNRVNCGNIWNFIGPDVFCRSIIYGIDTCTSDSGI